MQHNNNNIRAVVFDLGGVLLDWNPRYLYRDIFDSEQDMERFLHDICNPAWNLSLDHGIDLDEAVQELSTQYPDYRQYIMLYKDRWMDMVKDAVWPSVDIMEELRRTGYPLYSITNFHQDTLKACKKRFAFLNDFAGMAVSGELGIVKPDPGIYQALFDTYHLNPHRLLFIDDRPDNVSAGEAFGMRGIVFETPKQLRQDLITYGLLKQTESKSHG